jgi:hypothetical protein
MFFDAHPDDLFSSYPKLPGKLDLLPLSQQNLKLLYLPHHLRIIKLEALWDHLFGSALHRRYQVL